LGPFKFFYDSPVDVRVPIPILVPPYVFPLPIPPRAIPILIGAFVEGVRLLFSFGSHSNDTTRKILSIVLSVIDLLQGDWKQAILTFAGYYGQTPLVAGIVGKVFLNAFSLIAPDLQEALILDAFQSGKSMVAGLVAWTIATMSPDFVRVNLRKQLDAIRALVDDSNGEIQKLESSMQKSVGSNIQIQFHKIPDGMVPTFDDIQNLQTIAAQPAIVCSADFQKAIEPLQRIPIARFMLELYNIPTDPETLAMKCGTLAGKSLDDTVEQSIMPEIRLNPDSPLDLASAAEKPLPQGRVKREVQKIENRMQTKKGGRRNLKRRSRKSRH
jgi:hypothetical protein